MCSDHVLGKRDRLEVDRYRRQGPLGTSSEQQVQHL